MIIFQKKELLKFVELLQKEFDKGSVTCAVVCPNKEYALKTYKRIFKYQSKLSKDIVDFTQENYKTGVLVLPIENAKGLEFDTVILLDVNSDTYPDTELSTRLFYVAITRALHRLIIVNNSNKSPLLI